VDCIYACIKPQLDDASVDDEDFGRAMAGDAINNATMVLFDEIADFTPSEGRRNVLRQTLAKLWTAEDRKVVLMQEILDSGKVDRSIEAELQKLKKKALSLPPKKSTRSAGK